MFIIIFVNCEGRREILTLHNHKDAIKIYRCFNAAGFKILTSPP